MRVFPTWTTYAPPYQSLKLTGLDAQIYTKTNYLKRINKAAAPNDKI